MKLKLKILSLFLIASSTLSFGDAVKVILPEGDGYTYASEIEYWESITPLFHDYVTLEKIEIIETNGEIEGSFSNLISDAILTIRAHEGIYSEVDREEKDRVLGRRDFYEVSRSVSRVIRKLAVAGESLQIPVQICTLQSPSGFVVGPLNPVLDNVRPPSEFRTGSGIMYQIPCKGTSGDRDKPTNPLLINLLELIQDKSSLMGFMNTKQGMSDASFFEWKNISVNEDGTIRATDSKNERTIVLTPVIYEFADESYIFIETTIDYEGRDYPLYFIFDEGKSELIHRKQKELVRRDPGPQSVIIPLDASMVASYKNQFDTMVEQKEFLTKDWRKLLPAEEKLVWIGNELKNIDTLETYLSSDTNNLIFIEDHPGFVYHLKNKPESYNSTHGRDWRITASEFDRWKRDKQSRRYFGVTVPFDTFQLVRSNGSIGLEKKATPYDGSFLEKDRVEFYLSNSLQEIMYFREGDIWIAKIDWLNNTLFESKNITNLGIIDGISLIGWYKDWLYFENPQNKENPLLQINTTTKEILELPLPFKDNFFVNPSHSIVLQQSDDKMGIEVFNLHTDERFSVFTIGDAIGDSEFSILFWFNDYSFLTENYVYDLSARKRYPLASINPEIPAFLKTQRHIEYDPQNNCIKGAFALWDLDTDEIKKTRMKYPVRAWVGKNAFVFNVSNEGINRDGTYYKQLGNEEPIQIAKWPSVGDVVTSKGLGHVVFGTQPADTYRLNVFNINDRSSKVYELGKQMPYIGSYSFHSVVHPSKVSEDSLWFISDFAEAQSQEAMYTDDFSQQIEYIPQKNSSTNPKVLREFWFSMENTIHREGSSYSWLYLSQLLSEKGLLPDSFLEKKIELMAYHALSELVIPYVAKEGSEVLQEPTKFHSNPQLIGEYAGFYSKRYVAFLNAVTNENPTDLRDIFSASELSSFKDLVLQIRAIGKQGPKSRTKLEMDTILANFEAYLDDPRISSTSRDSYDQKIRADSNYAFSPTSRGIPEPFTQDQRQWLLTKYFVELYFRNWGSRGIIYDTWESQN